MDYITILEASGKWKLSQQQVQNLCVRGLVEGAVQAGRAWLIPKNAEKPIFEKPKRTNKKDLDTSSTFISTTPSFLHSINLYTVPGSADEVMHSLANQPQAQAFFATTIAYCRGEMTSARDYAKHLASSASDLYSINTSSFLLALVAIWEGDISLYQGAKGRIRTAQWNTIEEQLIVELFSACIDNELQPPSIENYPQWFRQGKFEQLPSDCLPCVNVLYIRFLMLAAEHSEAQPSFWGISGKKFMHIIPNIAEPLLARIVADKLVIPEIHLRLLVACVYHQLGDNERAISHIDKAIELALPDNLLGILAEHRQKLDDLLDERLFAINPETFERYKGLHEDFLAGCSKLYNALFSLT